MSNDTHALSGKKIAILVTDGFEQIELTEPRKALEQSKARTVLVSPKGGSVRAWNEKDWGDTFKVDSKLGKVRAEDFDGLVLPGGVINGDQLRMDEQAVHFVKEFFMQGKPVAAICHGPWILINAGVVKARTLTSYPSMQADFANAGAKWMDSEVISEEGLVTSRRPGDLPAFNRAMIEAFSRAHYEMQKPTEAFRAEQPPRTKLPV